MEFVEPMLVYLFAMVIALVYILFAFDPSGRFVGVDVVYDYGGLKAQGWSIAQGKRSVTLGN